MRKYGYGSQFKAYQSPRRARWGTLEEYLDNKEAKASQHIPSHQSYYISNTRDIRRLSEDYCVGEDVLRKTLADRGWTICELGATRRLYWRFKQ